MTRVVAAFLSMALVSCASAPPSSDDSPGVQAKAAVDSGSTLSCSAGADCAMLGALGVVTALAQVDQKAPAFRPDRRDSSIVIKCLLKRRESEMSFSCGPVAAKIQRHGSPTQENVKFRGGLFSLPVPKNEEYDIELQVKGCDIPEVVRGAKAGEVWTVTFELPCEPDPTPTQ